MSKVCKYKKCTEPAYKTGFCNAHYIRNRRGWDMDKPIRKKLSLEDRFFEKVEKSDHCWLWTGYKNPQGYGVINIKGTPRLAHRVSFELENGEIDSDLDVDHACHNVSCVNPRHLRHATRSMNMQNMESARKDSRSGIRGVRQRENGRWEATCHLNGKRFYLGRFDSADEAEKAASSWRRKHMPYSMMDQRRGKAA